MLTSTNTHLRDTASTTFFQERLAGFGRWGVILVGGIFPVRIVLLTIDGTTERLYQSDGIGHLLALLSLAGIWLTLRGSRPRSHGFLVGVEAIGLVGASASLGLMATGIPAEQAPPWVLLMCLMMVLTLRAIYVPSSPRRTLILQGVIGLIYLACLVPIHRQEGLGQTLTMGLLRGLTWWVLVTAVTTLAASAVYGLRKEVREAKQLGQYVLDEKLGEGGMGVVYRARHAMLRRQTAVKLLLSETAGELAIARFEREVRLTAQLNHPNIITIFDYGRTPEGVFYYAMELLDGLDLDRLIQECGPQDPARVVAMMIQICEALEEAHGVSLIHRDIKPANIFLMRRDRGEDLVKLLDFGLVKDLQADTPSDANLTEAQSIMGTPHYLSPEAITSDVELDGRSDLYAVGAVAYYLLTGHNVFEAKTIVEVISCHLRDLPVPPSVRAGVSISETLEEIVLRCLEKRREDRPASATDLRQMLASIEDVPGWTRDNAERWWASQGDSLRRQPTRDDGEPSRAPTMAVDVRSRV